MILDFNHLYHCTPPGLGASERDVLVASAHSDLVAAILLRLGDYAASRERHSPRSSLGELYATGARVFILYDDTATVALNEFLFPQNCIDSPWLNRTLPEKLLEEARNAWLEPSRRRPGAFFVCQGICTPDLDMIINSSVPMRGAFRSLDQLARLTTREVTAWLSRIPARGIAPAIFIADFFEDAGPVFAVPATSAFVRTVVQRNYSDHAAGLEPTCLPLMQRIVTMRHGGSSEAGAFSAAGGGPSVGFSSRPPNQQRGHLIAAEFGAAASAAITERPGCIFGVALQDGSAPSSSVVALYVAGAVPGSSSFPGRGTGTALGGK